MIGSRTEVIRTAGSSPAPATKIMKPNEHAYQFQNVSPKLIFAVGYFVFILAWPLFWIGIINYFIPVAKVDYWPRSLFVGVTVWMVTLGLIGMVMVWSGGIDLG